jgi:hypothetical protein
MHAAGQSSPNKKVYHGREGESGPLTAFVQYLSTGNLPPSWLGDGREPLSEAVLKAGLAACSAGLWRKGGARRTMFHSLICGSPISHLANSHKEVKTE